MHKAVRIYLWIAGVAFIVLLISKGCQSCGGQKDQEKGETRNATGRLVNEPKESKQKGEKRANETKHSEKVETYNPELRCTNIRPELSNLLQDFWDTNPIYANRIKKEAHGLKVVVDIGYDKKPYSIITIYGSDDNSFNFMGTQDKGSTNAFRNRGSKRSLDVSICDGTSMAVCDFLNAMVMKVKGWDFQFSEQLQTDQAIKLQKPNGDYFVLQYLGKSYQAVIFVKIQGYEVGKVIPASKGMNVVFLPKCELPDGSMSTAHLVEQFFNMPCYPVDIQW